MKFARQSLHKSDIRHRLGLRLRLRLGPLLIMGLGVCALRFRLGLRLGHAKDPLQFKRGNAVPA